MLLKLLSSFLNKIIVIENKRFVLYGVAKNTLMMSYKEFKFENVTNKE